MTCASYNKLYVGGTNRNFNTRFREHRKNVIYTEGKSQFSERVVKEGNAMKRIENTMSID